MVRRLSEMVLWVAGIGLAVAVAVAVAGCGAAGDDPASTTAGPATTVSPGTTGSPVITGSPGTTAGPGPTRVAAYFSRDEKISPVLRVASASDGGGAAEAAVEALLAGPTLDETGAGLASSIPEGTALLGLEVEGAVATVDLSASFASGGGSLSTVMRLAELVFTLTQFPGVTGVELELAGKTVDVFGAEGLVISHPMTRADFEDLSPAILVESPLPGETVSSPVRVSGTSNTFEATSLVKILDQTGSEVVFEVVTATSGSGTRGTFDVSIPFTVGAAGPGTIVAYEESAEDGSVINEVRVPVQLAK
jgi:germination protein M